MLIDLHLILEGALGFALGFLGLHVFRNRVRLGTLSRVLRSMLDDRDEMRAEVNAFRVHIMKLLHGAGLTPPTAVHQLDPKAVNVCDVCKGTRVHAGYWCKACVGSGQAQPEGQS